MKKQIRKSMELVLELSTISCEDNEIYRIELIDVNDILKSDNKIVTLTTDDVMNISDYEPDYKLNGRAVGVEYNDLIKIFYPDKNELFGDIRGLIIGRLSELKYPPKLLDPYHAETHAESIVESILDGITEFNGINKLKGFDNGYYRYCETSWTYDGVKITLTNNHLSRELLFDGNSISILSDFIDEFYEKWNNTVLGKFEW